MMPTFKNLQKGRLNGTHSYEYEVTSPASCGINAKETGTCAVCGETNEREVEGTALAHSFTKYEVVTAAECGKAGLERAVCDNNCGETDEKEIEALTHKDADGDYKCDNGCGYEYEKPADPTHDTPDEPAENDCDHLCHKSGFMGFIWKVVKLFWKLFKMNFVCECGAAYY